MCMSSPKMSAPPPPPPPPQPAKQAGAATQRARKESQAKSRSMQGDASTKLTGPRGLMNPANTATTTLLGS